MTTTSGTWKFERKTPFLAEVRTEGSSTVQHECMFTTLQFCFTVLLKCSNPRVTFTEPGCTAKTKAPGKSEPTLSKTQSLTQLSLYPVAASAEHHTSAHTHTHTHTATTPTHDLPSARLNVCRYKRQRDAGRTDAAGFAAPGAG